VAATFIWALFLLSLQGMQSEIAEELNFKTITAGDYSVWLTNLAGCDGDDKALQKFARHYGPVITAFHIKDVGVVLSKTNEVIS
jgi:hypothetical protein